MTIEAVPWVDLIGYFGGGVTLWGMYLMRAGVSLLLTDRQNAEARAKAV